MKIWTADRLSYLQSIASGRGSKETTDMVNQKFGLNLTVNQIKAGKKNHKVTSGLTGRFEKGIIPANKGKKQTDFLSREAIEKTRATQFKKGHKPVTTVPVGSERVDAKDGYTLVKTAEPNVWKLKHRIIWERERGKIPSGHLVIFLNGDRSDIRIENLALITRSVHARLNQSGLRHDNAEATRTGITVGELLAEIGNAKRRLK
jgi:hypothetical protein